MQKIDVLDETWDRLQKFRKVVDTILENDPLESDIEYFNLVLSIGLESMLKDILPKEESVLTNDITNMFRENPEFVSNHIVDTLNRGKDRTPAEQVKEKWLPYT